MYGYTVHNFYWRTVLLCTQLYAALKLDVTQTHLQCTHYAWISCTAVHYFFSPVSVRLYCQLVLTSCLKYGIIFNSRVQPLRPSHTDQSELSIQTTCLKQGIICNSLNYTPWDLNILTNHSYLIWDLIPQSPSREKQIRYIHTQTRHSLKPAIQSMAGLKWLCKNNITLRIIFLEINNKKTYISFWFTPLLMPYSYLSYPLCPYISLQVIIMPYGTYHALSVHRSTYHA
jgi:hypothetical protein